MPLGIELSRKTGIETAVAGLKRGMGGLVRLSSCPGGKQVRRRFRSMYQDISFDGIRNI